MKFDLYCDISISMWNYILPETIDGAKRMRASLESICETIGVDLTCQDMEVSFEVVDCSSEYEFYDEGYIG